MLKKVKSKDTKWDGEVHWVFLNVAICCMETQLNVAAAAAAVLQTFRSLWTIPLTWQ